MHPDQGPAARHPSGQPSDFDPFLLDHDRIQALAAADLVRAGLLHFRDNRVTEVGIEGDRLWATVEDAETEETVDLHLTFDGDGQLVSECACPTPGDGPCVHALAALFAWADRGAGEPAPLGAADGAIDERVKRGRTERGAGDAPLGRARFRGLDGAIHRFV